jgi:hypothetical protein
MRIVAVICGLVLIVLVAQNGPPGHLTTPGEPSHPSGSTVHSCDSVRMERDW